MTGAPQVIGLGLATLDLLVRTGELPTWDRGVTADGYALEGGGMSATAMFAARRLGATAGFVGVTGGDALSAAKLDGLGSEGVDLSRMVKVGDKEPCVVLVLVAPDGERVFMGFESIARQPLRVDDLDRAYLTTADLLHIDIMYPEAALAAAQWMREAGKPVLLDASKVAGGESIPDGQRRLAAAVDYLVSGSGFVEDLTGESELERACEKALEMGPSVVTQTLGRQGSFTLTRDGQRFHQPIFEAPVVDTTGAGDVFHGAYSFGLLKGWPLPRIVEFSTAVSALKCGKPGGRAGVPTFAQTLAFLEENGVDVAPYQVP